MSFYRFFFNVSINPPFTMAFATFWIKPPASLRPQSVPIKNISVIASRTKFRGAKGGYILEISPEEIKISNIISAVDEEVKMLNCKKESKKGCNNKSTKCITHNLWDQLDQHINKFFEQVKLNDLIKKNQILNK